MITFVPIQQAYKRKISRQERLKGLKYKSYGSCAYIGDDISPGCYGCFYSDAYYCGFMLGKDFQLQNLCNRDCVYCFEPHKVQQSTSIFNDWKLSMEWKEAIIQSASDNKARQSAPDCMQYYEFSGLCEPLLYLPVIRQIMRFLRGTIDPLMGTRGWAKIYTNGILLNEDALSTLAELAVDEIRVHPGASDFSDEVYKNIENAVKRIPIVAVETPAWPLHRKKLFEMLPTIADIGVKHLDICQVEIASGYQLKRIEKALGNIEIYQAFYPVLDDGGLVEDIMRKVLHKGYPYSVIDCNGFVKQSRSALSSRSYWNILNRRYPPEWERHRLGRKTG